ncbi:hypothetical protein QLX67_01105 [Balneolaceae bacterium ANBcel3]|nr:hypothetical protein [Balneolaceae bacterium ANBcel3]
MIIVSCAPTEKVTGEDVVDDAIEVEETPTKPSWFKSERPVWQQGDTIYVAVAAVSGDSLDAADFGRLAMTQYQQEAITWLLQKEERPVAFDDLSDEQKEEWIARLVGPGSGVLSEKAVFEEEAFFSEDGVVRFYLKRAFLASELEETL